MYENAITHLAAAAIDERSYREAEPTRQDRAARTDDSRLARALLAVGRMAPASGFLPWLPTVARAQDAAPHAHLARRRTIR